MIIAEETLKKIRESADIVKIISDYVKLDKKGGNFVGLCPFHQDTNPSMSVSQDKKIFKCFSCGASGNVFTFVQDYEKVSFVRSVQIVAEKTGIEVDIKDNESYQSLQKYYDILLKATNFYEFFLKNTNDGKTALEYLYKRHLTDDIIKKFKIGLAPKDVDSLYKTLLKEKHQPLDMIEAGIIRSGTSYYDVFRNRIIFPIDDLSGNIVGFSGRIYDNKKTEEAKYLNSSENIVFKKGSILYNYRQALNEIKMKDNVFLFEGFLDVIAAYRANIPNAIASMGTALTKEQIKAIAKATNNVVICYDGDFAGIEATKKAIHLFTEAKINVKVILMPEGSDPDDYINKYGKEKLYDLLNNQTISGIDYLYEVEKRHLITEDISSVEKFKNIIFKYMAYYKSNVLNEKYLQKLSNDLNISIDSLKKDFQLVPNKIMPEYQPESVIIDINQTKVKKARHKKTKYINAEKNLIKILYYRQDKGLILNVEKELKSKCVDKQNLSILMAFYDYYSKNDIFDEKKFKKLIQNQIEILEDIIKSNEIKIEDIQRSECIKWVNDYVKTIKDYQDEKKLLNIANDVEDNPNENQENNLKEYQEIKRNLIKIKNSQN